MINKHMAKLASKKTSRMYDPSFFYMSCSSPTQAFTFAHLYSLLNLTNIIVVENIISLACSI